MFGCASSSWQLILASGKVAVDETVAPVLDPGRGRTKQGYFWAVARDDRPWGGTDPPAIAYSYAPGRGAVHGLKLLDQYRGIVQCDGFLDMVADLVGHNIGLGKVAGGAELGAKLVIKGEVDVEFLVIRAVERPGS